MEYTEFQRWLEEERGMGFHSSKDVISRARRVLKTIGNKDIDESTMEKLVDSDVFRGYSMSVKSQLKRAVTLYLEYVSCKK